MFVSKTETVSLMSKERCAVTQLTARANSEALPVRRAGAGRGAVGTAGVSRKLRRRRGADAVVAAAAAGGSSGAPIRAMLSSESMSVRA